MNESGEWRVCTRVSEWANEWMIEKEREVRAHCDLLILVPRQAYGIGIGKEYKALGERVGE